MPPLRSYARYLVDSQFFPSRILTFLIIHGMNLRKLTACHNPVVFSEHISIIFFPSNRLHISITDYFFLNQYVLIPEENECSSDSIILRALVAIKYRAPSQDGSFFICIRRLKIVLLKI
jgi:hypothetical protein